MKQKVLLSLMVTILFCSCGKDDDADKEIKKDNFNSTEEFIENPSVSDAVNESNIPIYEGDTPPPLAGTYLLDGIVEDASYAINELVGMQINSEIIFSNQTNTGKIDFQEKVMGIIARGSGGYITGNNGKFTIWQESRQSGDEAGLPDDITITVVLLMSGTKNSVGDLNAHGISIITKVETQNQDYDTKLIEGIWWMWDGDFDLIGGVNALTKTTSSRNGLKIFNCSNAINLTTKER